MAVIKQDPQIQDPAPSSMCKIILTVLAVRQPNSPVVCILHTLLFACMPPVHPQGHNGILIGLTLVVLKHLSETYLKEFQKVHNSKTPSNTWPGRLITVFRLKPLKTFDVYIYIPRIGGGGGVGGPGSYNNGSNQI